MQREMRTSASWFIPPSVYSRRNPERPKRQVNYTGASNVRQGEFPEGRDSHREASFGGLAQTLFFNVCDLPKAPFAQGCDETPRPPLWSLREIADSKLRSLRQPPGLSSRGLVWLRAGHADAKKSRGATRLSGSSAAESEA